MHAAAGTRQDEKKLVAWRMHGEEWIDDDDDVEKMRMKMKKTENARRLI